MTSFDRMTHNSALSFCYLRFSNHNVDPSAPLFFSEDKTRTGCILPGVLWSLCGSLCLRLRTACLFHSHFGCHYNERELPVHSAQRFLPLQSYSIRLEQECRLVAVWLQPATGQRSAVKSSQVKPVFTMFTHTIQVWDLKSQRENCSWLTDTPGEHPKYLKYWSLFALQRTPLYNFHNHKLPRINVKERAG